MSEENKVNNEIYDAGKIKVLGNIEAVRTRYSMYTNGPIGMLYELIDNGVDEATAGHCNEIKVEISSDQSTITVSDNGRGIPIEIHPETKKSTLETIATTLHSGGKFDNKVYKTSGGLHGVGLTVVNALSEKFRIENKRDDKIEIMNFEKGILIDSKIIQKQNKEQKNGVSVIFTPDRSIFEDFLYFEVPEIENRLEELAYLNPNLTLKFSNESKEYFVSYNFNGGLFSLIEKINSKKSTIAKIFQNHTEIKKGDKKYQINFAFQYCDDHLTIIKSFCNNINTELGGTHVDGLENGLLKSIQNLISKRNPNSLINFDILRQGLRATISVNIQNPQFLSQSKFKLVNKELRSIISPFVQNSLNDFFQDNTSDANKISQKIINNISIEANTEEQRQLLRSNKQEEFISELASSISLEEISIVEGESAAGGLARNKDTQSVFSITGKPLNVWRVGTKKALSNEIIKKLLNVLGFSDINSLLNNYYNDFRYLIEKNKEDFYKEEETLKNDFFYKKEDVEIKIPSGKNLSFEETKKIIEETLNNLLKKSRYKKIILMADPDPDGGHILLLLTTFIFKYLPYLIEGEKIFIACAPFYRLERKNEIVYFYNEKEYREYREKNPEKRGERVERIKGLGQMDASELWESTMNPEKRRLYGLEISDLNNTKLTIDKLMGTNSSSRKILLENHRKFFQIKELIIKENNKIDLAQALEFYFFIYSLSVIGNRALPDIDDGFKPVQRYILYTLYLKGNSSEPTSSANIVGETLSNFHPHGDQSIYGALVNMVRSDIFRYPFVSGRGNFGYDNSPSAAMRYTRVWSNQKNKELLGTNNLPFGVLSLINNFDDSKKVIVVFPSLVPIILINGSSAIAVGMSTNIPSHNLTEVINATIELIKNPNLTIKEILENYIFGPDFSTGGTVLEKDNLLDIYEKGKGTIYIRAEAKIISSEEINSILNEKEITTNKKSKNIILITQLPYKISKSNLVKNISFIIKNKKIEGLISVNDYSDLKGMNLQIRFNPDYNGEAILNKLYAITNLQAAFSIQLRALIEGEPKIFSLKECLERFIYKRLIDISKESEFILQKNNKELLNLNNRIFVINNYSKIIEIIKNGTDLEVREKLNFNFEEVKEGKIKTDDILDMSISFRQFTSTKKEELQNKVLEINEKNLKLASLILDEEERRLELVSQLEKIRENYKDDFRRTKIISDSHKINERSLFLPKEIIIIFSIGEKQNNSNNFDNYLNIYDSSSLETTNIRGVGKELKTRGENFLVIKSNNRDDLWCFSNFGKLYIIAIYKISSSKTINLRESETIKLSEGEKINFMLSVREGFFLEKNKKEKYLLILTKKGKIKRLDLNKIGKVPFSGKKISSILKYSDEIIKASFSSGNDQLMIFTKNGKNKSFSENKIKIKGRSSYGDNAIRTEEKSKIRCDKHKINIEEHKISNCCDKTKGIKAYSNCKEFRNITKEIKKCKDCNNNLSIIKNFKNMAVSLEVIEENSNKENLFLLAIREDNSAIKKSFASIFRLSKRIGGYGQNCFKIEDKKTSIYCDEHYDNLSKLENLQKNHNQQTNFNKLEIKRLRLILIKAEEEKVNEEVLVKYKNELNDFYKKSKDLEIKLNKRKKDLEIFKNKIKNCFNCLKNCKNHEEAKKRHEEGNCCDKKKNEIKNIKDKINISKNKKDNVKYYLQYENLKKSSLKNRVSCDNFQKINKEIRECFDCKEQKRKKKVKINLTSILKVLLINKNLLNNEYSMPEIYLLAGKSICIYKRNLNKLFDGKGNKKIRIYGDQNKITDINFYN